MCGIFGELRFNGKRWEDARTCQRMGDALRHRGPDQSGLFQDSHITLGHRRLSVIDLSEAGRQPMSNEDESIWIVFNGEIYNFQDLRPQLEQNGHRFRSQTDSEVILHLYERDGISCLDKLRGMFALAIWDGRRKSLLLARDRLGKKPLFYYHDASRLVFASEMKALLEHPAVSREIDPEAVDEYLAYQYVPAPRCIFRNIKKLLPAHYLWLQGSQLEEHPYWSLDFATKLKDTNEEALGGQLVRLLDEATRIRLRSDVPLGAFLSGGVDSSAIVAMMARHTSAPVKTFSIGFEESDYNELKYARMVAKRFGTEHSEFVVKPEATEVLPLLVWHYDEPYSDSSALPTYYLSKLTQAHVTVALNGDGGDEAFAGYEKYRAMKLFTRLNSLPHSIRHALQRFGAILPEQPARRNLLRKLKRFLHTSTGNVRDEYVSLMTLFSAAEKRLLYTREFAERLREAPPAEHFLITLLDRSSQLNWVDRISSTDILSYLPNDLLVKVDRASMAHALELRSPFLDHKVMEFAASLPPKMKVSGLTTKYLLKHALSGVLPKEILHRKKMGFGVPLNHWFRSSLKEFATATLLSQSSLARNYFQRGYVQHLVSEHIERRKDNAYKIWNLLILEIWHQTYMD